MIFKYGDYTSENGECDVKINRVPRHSATGYYEGYTETWTIIGFLTGANTAALTTALNSMKEDFVDGGNLRVLDGASATTHTLLSSSCLGGTKVTRAPSFTQNQGAEYITYRTWEAAVEGFVQSESDEDNPIVDYHESTEHTGGLPLRLWHLSLNSGPIKQTTTNRTTYVMRQSGYAVGRDDYPAVNDPAVSETLLMAKAVRKEGPRRLADNAFENYRITWDYTFEDSEPFTREATEGEGFPPGGETTGDDLISPTP